MKATKWPRASQSLYDGLSFNQRWKARRYGNISHPAREGFYGQRDGDVRQATEQLENLQGSSRKRVAIVS